MILSCFFPGNFAFGGAATFTAPPPPTLLGTLSTGTTTKKTGKRGRGHPPRKWPKTRWRRGTGIGAKQSEKFRKIFEFQVGEGLRPGGRGKTSASGRIP